VGGVTQLLLKKKDVWIIKNYSIITKWNYNEDIYSGSSRIQNKEISLGG